jgi:hypothetical protein
MVVVLNKTILTADDNMNLATGIQTDAKTQEVATLLAQID